MKGLDFIGINSVQENWIIINKRLDEENRYEMDFHNAILIVSASNGKGAQSLQKSYTSRSRELKELRDEICKLGHVSKRKEEHDKEREKWTAPVNTKEDLVRELYRQMSGKKDRHDLYMDRWIQDQKDKSESAKNKVVERQREFRKNIETIEMGSMESSKPISAQELDRVLKEKKIRVKKDKDKSDVLINQEKSERVLKKIGHRVISSDK
jgi:arylamine N-acetyltransferase